MKQNQGNCGNRRSHKSCGGHGIHGSRESHEVIAVGRGRCKKNNPEIHNEKVKKIYNFYLTDWLMNNHPMIDMVTNYPASLSDNSFRTLFDDVWLSFSLHNN
ncbi:10994_t:CDS:2 [Entrophospora sp. SA101]|nr:10994_t:CDS:2 [Entrophospora sp. SA101]